MIYADYAATTPLDKRVLDKMMPYFSAEFGNASSLHEAGRKCANAVENARQEIASIINADKNEIYFTSGGTESNNWALFGVVTKEKNHIITSSIEHHSVLNACKELEKRGCTVTYVSANESGIIDADEILKAITPQTAVISVMAANNEIGTVQQIKEIGAIAKKNGTYFFTDAVQAMGKMPIDVKEMNVDLLSASAHKFFGPKGVGFLYARKGINLNNVFYGGSQERDRRPGTLNVPGIIGMAEALKIQIKEQKEREEIEKRLTKIIKDIVFEKLSGVILNGDENKRLSGNLNFSFDGISVVGLTMLLDLSGIYCSAGAACSSGSVTSSHVLESISNGKVKEGLRVSVSYQTTEEEAKIIGNSIVENVNKMRNK
ncbi:MAG: cysteine desulfurase [Clostridia bacterium]|nr:cysteine desulfurase [Clostridia bacterium]